MARDAALSAERLTSIDAFRGLTVAGMLLVNDPGDAATVFAPLAHSAWHGWTPTDLIFPFFLFIVGVTTHLSLTRRAARGDDDAAIRRQILRRAALLFALGLLANWFPFYQSGAIAGHPDPRFGDRVVARLLSLRVMGVLQRIALAYLAASLLSWKASTRRVAWTTAAALVGYWLLMTLVRVPGEGVSGHALLGDPSRNLAAWVDRAALDWSRWGLGNHLWDAGVTRDPEGLLSTIPAVGSVLSGVLAGRWLATARPIAERLSGLCVAGALGMAAGAAWGWVFPINKPIWTSSYALFAAGMACVALGVVAWAVDVHRGGRWVRPLVVYGTNAIVAFVGSELLAKILHSSLKWKLDGRRVGTEQAFTRLVASAGVDPRVASLAWAVLFVLLWYAILQRLYRRGLFVRV